MARPHQLELEPDCDSEPQDHTIHYGLKLLGRQASQGPHQPDCWHRNKALSVEGAGPQETNGHRHFISGATKTCGMWNVSDQGTILVGGGRSEHQARTNFRRQAEVNEPDLAPAWRSHA